MGVVRVAATVDRKLGEAGLDQVEEGAVAVGFEGELDVGATGVGLGEVGESPGVPEHRRLLDDLDGPARLNELGRRVPNQPLVSEILRFRQTDVQPVTGPATLRRHSPIGRLLLQT